MAKYIPDSAGLPAWDLIEELGVNLAARYADAEDALIRAVAVRAYRDLELQEIVRQTTMTPHMTDLFDRAIARNRALAELQATRAQSLRELQYLATEMSGKLGSREAALDVITTAWKHGEAAAADRLGMAARLPQTTTLTGTSSQAATMLTLDLTSRLETMALRIARYPQDAFQRVISFTASNTILGASTNLASQQLAVQRFLGQGITGFVDKADRNWRIGSYAEMAGRTAVNRAFNDAGVWRMQQVGVNLVTPVGAGDSCSLCAPWVGKILSTDGTTGTVQLQHATSDEIVTVQIHATLDAARAAGLHHPNCFPGFVPVSAPTGIAAADSRWFEGEVIIIHTSAGHEVTVTPNHPILTTEGWVDAGALVEGQDLLSYRGNVEHPLPGGPDHEGVETPIGEVYETLRKSRHVTTRSVPGSSEDFHGDGIAHAQVEVVFADRLLRADGEAESFNGAAEGEFLGCGVGLAPFLSEGSFVEVILSALHATDGVMGGATQVLPLGGARRGEAAAHGLTGRDLLSGLADPELDDLRADANSICDFHLREALGSVEADSFRQPSRIDAGRLDRAASGPQPATEGISADSNGGRDLRDALSGLVSEDCIVNIERRGYSGHVYNLQSGGGWYTADSIVVHNCRHKEVAYLPGLTIPQAGQEYDPQAEAAREKQRSIERDIRKYKRREAVAGTPADEKRAALKVRAKQAQMREHIDLTGRKRASAREQLSFADGKP